jgi:hypothetical protein
MNALSRVLALMGAAAVVGACSQDGSTPVGIPASPSALGTSGSTGGTDSSQTPPPSTPTSSGPVSSVVVTPHQLTLSKGNYGVITAVAQDANGVMVAGKRATLRSSDPNVVVISDTGVAYAKAVGSAKVYATVDGKIDSASVTVVEGSTPTPPPPTSTPGIAQFDLTLTVVGAVAGSDTANVSRVAGAVVKLSRIGGVKGDSLSTPIAAGMGTTDANGVVSLKGLAGGSYAVEVDPPSGSGYMVIQTGFAPPAVSDFKLAVKLSRQ